MKRKLRIQVVSLLLTAIFLMEFIPLKVNAAEFLQQEVVYIKSESDLLQNPDVVFYGKPNLKISGRDASYLINCNISAAYRTYGLYVQLETGTTKTATEIGVKDVKVQEKSGIFWNTIMSPTGNSVKNDDTFVGGFDCKSAVSGKTYRIKCTHYAYIGGNYYHYDHTSDSFTYVKP